MTVPVASRKELEDCHLRRDACCYMATQADKGLCQCFFLDTGLYRVENPGFKAKCQLIICYILCTPVQG